mgnify:CR=1 FL=1
METYYWNNTLKYSVGLTSFYIKTADFSISVGSQISNGSMAANNTAGVQISGLVIGNYYAVEGSGGPFTAPNIGTAYSFNLFQDPNRKREIGAAGWGSYDNSFHNRYTPPGVFVEIIPATYYGRLYFKAVANSVFITAGNAAANYVGSLGFILSNAIALGGERRVLVRSVNYYNVCLGSADAGPQ